MKKILVTGAEGFIGSHLTEALVASGHQVTAFVQYNSLNSWGWLDSFTPKDSNALEVVLGDLRDYSSVKHAMKGCDIVFHLGALIAIPYSYRAPKEYIETNVTGTLHVMQACLDHEVKRVVHTSTSEVYGTALSTPMDEQHPLQAQSPYAASKIGADKIAESFCRSYQLPVVTLRPFNTYGPRQSARAVLPTIVCQALQQDSIKLGALDPIRDLTFVADTVNGFLKSMFAKLEPGEVINLGTGTGISVGELAQQVLKAMGVSKPIVEESDRLRPAQSEVRKLISNNEKAAKLLGWKPETTLSEGIRQTVDWFRENIAHYKSKAFVV